MTDPDLKRPRRPDGGTLRVIGALGMAGGVFLWFTAAMLPQPMAGTQDRDWLDAIRWLSGAIIPYGFATWAVGHIVAALYHLPGRDD